MTWVTYGTSPQFGQESKSSAYATEHAVTLTGLLANTTYYFHIATQNEDGETAPDTTATVYSTFKTLGSADIAALQARLADLLTQLRVLQAASPVRSGLTFTRTLKQGDSGEDVRQVQVLLNKNPATRISESGVGSPGQETTYFGPATKAAIIKFQELYRSEVLDPSGLKRGTGIVGAMTRAKMQSLGAVAEETIVVTAPEGRAAAVVQAEDFTRGGWGGGGGGTSAAVVIPEVLAPAPIAPVVVNSYGPLAPAPLATPDYYVTPTGNGTHIGTYANPFSLREAQTLANQTANLSRSIVFSLAGGEYGGFVENTSRGLGAWVTYQAANLNNKPIFRGSATTDAIYVRNAPAAYIAFVGIAAYNDREIAFEAENANYVKLLDSYIEGPSDGMGAVGYAVRAYNAHNFTLQNSVIRNGSNGISTLQTNDLVIINNDFSGQLVDGVHISDTTRFTIMGNNIHDGSLSTAFPDAHVDGVQFDASTGGIRLGVFSKNRIANFQGQGFFMSPSGKLASNVTEDIIIADNLITGVFTASPFQVEGKRLTIAGNTVAPISPIISLLTENAEASNVYNNIFTDKFLNCAATTPQNHNLIGMYLTFGCNGRNVIPGANDVVGTAIGLDSSYSPLVDQTYTTTSGLRVSACAMSSIGETVGARPCAGVYTPEPSIATTPQVTTPAATTPTADTAPASTPAPTPDPTPTPAPIALAAHWSFNDGSIVESTLIDVSGHNLSGALVNAPAVMDGHAGQALLFNDANDQSIRLDSSLSTLNRGADPYTISAWIYPTDMSALIGSHFGGGIIRSIGNGGSGSQGDFYLSVAGNGELVFTNWQASGDQPNSRHYVDLTNPSNTTIGANSWYHIVATWDGIVTKCT